MDKNLDLSSFPKITPPDDADEISQRSKSLTAIREVMENLINLMQSYLVELQSFDSKAKYLDKRETHLREYEYEVRQKEKKILQLDESIKQEKEYIHRANQDLKAREQAVAEDKNYLEEIESAKLEWEERKTEALKIEARNEEKLKMVEALNKRQQELDEKEAVLERSAAVDAERKRLMDIREERIKNKELRLGLDQQE